jgi:hypothetical protein
VPITPLRRTPTHGHKDTHAGYFTTTRLALRELSMIGFKSIGVTASNRRNRPPTAALTYPKPLWFEKSRLNARRR